MISRSVYRLSKIKTGVNQNMSANPATTTPTTNAAPAAPAVTLGVSESAAGEIKKFMSSEEGLPESAGLRVRVVPGGCSGFQYSLNIEEESRQGDFVLDEKGVRLFVDMFSAQYLNGVEIDYVQNVMGSGFTFKNPNSTGSCGCGSSFTA
jgi:iron-sulfur cluster assembly protein